MPGSPLPPEMGASLDRPASGRVSGRQMIGSQKQRTGVLVKICLTSIFLSTVERSEASIATGAVFELWLD